MYIRRALLLLFFLSFMYIKSFGQDIIYNRLKQKLKVDITSTDSTSVRFKSPNVADTNVYIANKRDILWIQYRSGKIDTLNRLAFDKKATFNDTVSTKSTHVALDSVTYYEMGRTDAYRFYNASTSTHGWGLTTGILFPLGGTVMPIVVGSVKPRTKNLHYPSEELFKNPYYRKGYISMAMSIKRRAVWGNHAIGALLTTAGALLVGLLVLRVYLSSQ